MTHPLPGALAQPLHERGVAQHETQLRREVLRILPVQQRTLTCDFRVVGDVEGQHAIAVAQRLQQGRVRSPDFVPVDIGERAAVQLADVAGLVHRPEKHDATVGHPA